MHTYRKNDAGLYEVIAVMTETSPRVIVTVKRAWLAARIASFLNGGASIDEERWDDVMS